MEDINKGGNNRGINTGEAEDEAPVVAKTGTTTTGVVVAAPHLLITWPRKVAPSSWRFNTAPLPVQFDETTQ
jgi:hypothetical protein